jgi:hypothetical protein
MSQAVVSSYVTNAPPDGLLIMGGYDYQQGSDLKQAFWARRFVFEIPEPQLEELCLALLPFIATFRAQAADVPQRGEGTRLSVHFHLAALMFIARAAVQDSFELADIMPTNPIVIRLQDLPTWQVLRRAWVEANKHGVSGCGTGVWVRRAHLATSWVS